MKKIKNYKIILMLLLPVWLLTNATSCNTDPPCACTEFQDISEEMKGYVDFSQGDYWVYQLKQDTDIRDTLTCTNKRILDNKCASSQIISGNANPCSKIYRLSLTHSNVNYFPHYTIDATEPGVEQINVEVYPNYNNYSLERELPNKSSYETLFNTPYYDPNFVLSNKDQMKAKIVNSITINQKPYSEILLSELNDFMQTSEFVDSLFIKSSIGIVSYKNEPNQTWELLKYVKQ
jgi:hypothetical protein